jgi:ribonuclease HIII
MEKVEKTVAVFFKLPLGARAKLKQAAAKLSNERGYRVSMTQLLLEYIESL